MHLQASLQPSPTRPQQVRRVAYIKLHQPQISYTAALAITTMPEQLPFCTAKVAVHHQVRLFSDLIRPGGGIRCTAMPALVQVFLSQIVYHAPITGCRLQDVNDNHDFGQLISRSGMHSCRVDAAKSPSSYASDHADPASAVRS